MTDQFEMPSLHLNERQQKELISLVDGVGVWDEEKCHEPVFIKGPDCLGTQISFWEGIPSNG